MTLGRSRDDESAKKWTGPQDADARRTQRDLVEGIRSEAEKRNVQWGTLMDRAGLSRASRSRLNAGIAGISTIGRMRRALDELTAGRPVGSERVEDETEVETRHASSDRRKRWVVVQCKDRRMFVGVAWQTDDEIADKGRVRLERCRPIESVDASAATLAAIGPSGRGIVGTETPSALILDVAVVYDATKGAMRAFDLAK